MKISLKILILVVGVFFMMSHIAPVLAADEYKEPFLSKYDKELKKPPFSVRYKFMKENGKSWKNTTYEERLDFIRSWESNAEQRAINKKYEDINRKIEKENKKMQRQYAQEEKEFKKQQYEYEAKFKKQEEKLRREEFKRAVTEQKRKLKELKARQNVRKQFR